MCQCSLTIARGRYRNAGEPKEGLEYLDEARDLIESNADTRGRGRHASSRCRAIPAALPAISVGGRASFRQAIAVARRQSAKLLELRAAISLARLWRDQGKRAEARDLLGPIYNWFTEGFDAPDLKDAKALLDELTS